MAITIELTSAIEEKLRLEDGDLAAVGKEAMLTELYREGRLGLGTGEAQAIRLAQELRADAVLIDERLAATIARQAGLFVTGTLGVLEVAAERGLIDLVQAVVALKQTTFRVSDRVLDGLLQRDADRRRQLSGGSDSGVGQ